MGESSEGLRDRLRAEIRMFGILFVYLAVLFGTFTTYKRLLLAEYGISFFQYGSSLLEAFILAKAILVGRMLHLGERFRDRPLIVPTLYKTLCFGLLVVALTLVEHLVSGWWHGGEAAATAGGSGAAFWEGLARMLVLIAGFVPLFAVWEASRFVDGDALARLFLSGKRPELEFQGMHDLKRAEGEAPRTVRVIYNRSH